MVLHMKHLFQLFELDVLLGNMHVAYTSSPTSYPPVQVCVWGLAQMEAGMLKQ